MSNTERTNSNPNRNHSKRITKEYENNNYGDSVPVSNFSNRSRVNKTEYTRTVTRELDKRDEKTRGLIEKLGKGVLAVTAAAAIIVAGHLSAETSRDINNGSGGNPERFDGKDTTISSITIGDGKEKETVTIRSDPEVKNGADDHNIIDQKDVSASGVKIDTPEGAYIAEDSYNGRWYGIPIKDLNEALGTDYTEGKDGDDEDGVAWINVQRITTVQHSEETSEAALDPSSGVILSTADSIVIDSKE